MCCLSVIVMPRGGSRGPLGALALWKKKKKPALLKLRLFNLFIRCFERMSLVLHLRYNLAGSSGDWFSFAVLHSRTFWRFAPHLRYYLEGSSGGWWRIFRPRSSHYLVLCFSFLRSLLLLLCRIFFVIGLYLSICFCAYNFALFVILLFLVSLFLPLRPPTPPHPTPPHPLLMYVLLYIIASVCWPVHLCLNN